MATKTDKKANSNLPLTTDDLKPSSNITYNNEVVAIIAGLAANEVEGIAGMCTVGGNLRTKNRNVTKGVKVEVGTEEVAVDLYVIVEYGIPIQRAAADAQENVRKAIESMTGLHVVRVDVHVQSVSFEQEKKALQAGAQNAALEAGDSAAETARLPETKKAPTAKPAETKPAASEAGAKAEPAQAEPVKAEPAKEEPAKAEEKTAPKGKQKAETKKAKPVKESKKPEAAPETAPEAVKEDGKAKTEKPEAES